MKITRPHAVAGISLLFCLLTAPLTGQRNEVLASRLRELTQATGPQGVETPRFDALIRGDRLYYRDGQAPLTTPYTEIVLDRRATQIAASGTSLFVWLEQDFLLQFRGRSDGSLDVPQVLPVSNAEAHAALAEHQARVAMAARSSREPDPRVSVTNPSLVVINPSRLFVANSGGGLAGTVSGDSMSVINTATNGAANYIALSSGDTPTDVAIAPDNSKGYVANYGCSTCTNRLVTVFDPATMAVQTTKLAPAIIPYCLAVNSDGTRVYVGDMALLRIFDQNGALISSVNTGVAIGKLIVSPDNKTVYILQSSTAPTDRLSTYSVGASGVNTAKSFASGSACAGMALHPNGQQLYISCITPPQVFSFSVQGSTVTQTQVIDTHPTYALALSPDGKKLYAPHADTNFVDVLDSSTLSRVTQIGTGSAPINIVVSQDGTRAYTANYTGNSVSALDLVNGANLANIAVGPQPQGLALTTPAPVVAATPLQLTFTGGAGQASPAAQNVALSVSSGTISWTATTSTVDGAKWLNISSASGSFPATLSVSVNTTGLAPGNYSGSVNITTQGTSNSPLTIGVSLTVNPSGTLSVDPPQVSFQVIQGGPAPAPVTVNITNSGSGGNINWTSVVFPVSSWLNVTAANGNTPTAFQVGVNPQGLPPGQLSATLTISSSGAAKSITFTVTLTILPGPTISAGGIVNGASFVGTGGVAPGSLISIFGSNIGPATGVGSSGLPLPTTLSNVKVTMGGYAAPLIYVSATQINCQVPFELAGQSVVQVVVQNGTATSATFNLNIAAVSPGIFSATVNGNVVGAVLNEDYSANLPGNPAVIGHVVQIFATGEGVVSNQPASGSAAPGGPNLATTATNPVVLIGGQPAPVAFSGLSPGFVGLWQVNATVPAGVTPGNAVTLQIIQGTVTSNVVNIAVVSQ